MSMVARRLMWYFPFLGLVCFSCTTNNDASVSSSTSDHVKNLSEYTWGYDTTFSQTSLVALDGLSATEVFAVGVGADSHAVAFGNAGGSWGQVLRRAGTSHLYDIAKVGTGLLWAVGEEADSGIVLQYAGGTWTEVAHPSSTPLHCVDGATGSDMLVGGDSGVVQRCYEGFWTTYSLGANTTIRSIAVIGSGDAYAVVQPYTVSENTVHALYYLYHFNGVGWSKCDSVVSSGTRPEFGVTLYQRLGRMYAVAPGLWFYNVGSWIQYISADKVVRMYMHDASDILAVGSAVYHYNGEEWYTWADYSNSSIAWKDCWLDGATVYIIGTAASQSYVLHGK